MVLVGPTGMTLYMYARDTAGASVCTGGCASAWPPLTVTTAPAVPAGFSGKITLVKRDDGSQQVAYDGHPLYGFAGDTAPGQANGQGSGNVWFVVTK
jgi:predicted lipoprotein with Yx(FWY)xxD motif